MQLISEIMSRDVMTVAPQDTIQRAAQLMEELDVGAIPVCDGDRVIGMVTDRDITVRSTSAGESPDKTMVRDIMSVGIKTCFEDQPVDDVMEQMRDVQIRRIPVLDHETQQLIGIVSLGDVATKHSAEVDRTLDEISRPAGPDRQSLEE